MRTIIPKSRKNADYSTLLCQAARITSISQSTGQMIPQRGLYAVF
jgi:hypothetical protein